MRRAATASLRRNSGQGSPHSLPPAAAASRQRAVCEGTARRRGVSGAASWGVVRDCWGGKTPLFGAGAISAPCPALRVRLQARVAGGRRARHARGSGPCLGFPIAAQVRMEFHSVGSRESLRLARIAFFVCFHAGRPMHKTRREEAGKTLGSVGQGNMEQNGGAAWQVRVRVTRAPAMPVREPRPVAQGRPRPPRGVAAQLRSAASGQA